MSLLQLQQLRVGYGQQMVVKHVDLQLEAGQSMGIVGESGSGKSTLAKAIAGLLRPSSGKFFFDGAEQGQFWQYRWGRWRFRPPVKSSLRQRLQMVFQDPLLSLNPTWTVRELILEGAAGVEPSIQEERLELLLSQLGLQAACLSYLPQRLSGGQRQRVALARALISRPKLLVADEPTSSLDVSVQAHIVDLLQNLRQSEQMGSFALLFISHDVRVVARLCSHVAIMQRGRIVEYGPTAQLLDAPKHPYSQALLRSAL